MNIFHSVISIILIFLALLSLFFSELNIDAKYENIIDVLILCFALIHIATWVFKNVCIWVKGKKRCARGQEDGQV